MVGQQQVADPAPDQAIPDDHAPDGAVDLVEAAERLRGLEPMVRRICTSRLRGPDGEDAAQRTLERIWKTAISGRDMASGRPIESWPAYAAATAKFQVLTRHRDAARHAARPSSDLAEHVWADTGPGPAAQAERADEVAHARERVEALLAQLSPRQAEVMRATALAGRSSEDAARELGISADGLRSIQVRAMARMRELCGTQSPNPLSKNVPYSQQYATRTARATAAGEAAAPRAGDPLVEARVSVARAAGAVTAAHATAGAAESDPARRAHEHLAQDDADLHGLDDGTDSTGDVAVRGAA